MHSNMKFKFSSVIALMILMAACTSLHPSQTAVHFKKIPWETRQAKLKQLTHWEMRGAFSVKHHNKAVIARFIWQQNANNYRISIHSSLNLIGLYIIGQPGHVKLWKSSKQIYYASNPEILMQQQLGWHLPISNLLYWIRGIPAPGNHHATFDSFNHLAVLQQQGWRINYERYLQANGFDLPSVIELSQANLQVKIVIKRVF